MNSGSRKKLGAIEKFHGYLSDPEDPSPVKRKRARLEDDGCNNNVDNSPKISNWSCAGDTSLVEPEILEDMGVSVLEDEKTNLDSPKNETTQEPVLSLVNAEELRKTLAKEKSFDKDDRSRDSSSETINGDRLDEIEDLELKEPNFGSQKRVKSELLNISNSSIDEFCIYRRKRRLSSPGEDKFNKLSDEIILMILKWLPKNSLVRSMSVCKRWYRVTQDEALWSRVDLSGKVLNDGALGHIVPRGVQILRMAQTEIVSPIFLANTEALVENFVSKLQYLDLSMAVINTQDLAVFLSICVHLKKLSLEKCKLDRACCDAIRGNRGLEVLNLSMCEGLDLDCIKSLVKSQRLLEFNVAWCGLDSDSISYLCKYLSSTVLGLNLSGCRKAINNNNIADLVIRCPGLVELDLSDCTMLSVDTAKSLLNLANLKHLSLSRCYNIPTQTLLQLTFVPNLRYIDIFGVMTEATFKTFMLNAGEANVNKFRFSAIARPTVGVRRTSIWGLRVRD